MERKEEQRRRSKERGVEEEMDRKEEPRINLPTF